MMKTVLFLCPTVCIWYYILIFCKRKVQEHIFLTNVYDLPYSFQMNVFVLLYSIPILNKKLLI